MDFHKTLEFYKGKRVLVTGHTGFKGSWLCRLLQNAGADVYGYALSPDELSLFHLARIEEGMTSMIGDVRDAAALRTFFEQARPEIVFHLAAQPIVREGYRSPAYTYETNVMGTVNLLDCVRQVGGVRSLLNVTTDKVYESTERADGYRESDPLDGFDPYANSKSCSELVTATYRRSFFADGTPAISTARAGNVIGGGDFSADRIIPDCVRAAVAGNPVVLRHPGAVRPFQHVLEPLFAYLMIAAAQAQDGALSGCYNVGPDVDDCVQTGELTDFFVRAWGDGMTWKTHDDHGPHESGYLKLDCAKLKATFGWSPRWHVQTAVEKTVEWEKCRVAGGDVRACMDAQIADYLA